MTPETRKLLQDMKEAAADVQNFTAGKQFNEFIQDKQLRLAVERAFEIIGEALTRLRKIDAPIAEQISDWRAIIGFRNILIHGYATINHTITWDIVQTELPTLCKEIDALLAQ